jgi:RHS repeat-associated protein
MTSANTDAVAQSWSYDAAGRPSGIDRGGMGAFTYEWDASSNLTSSRYSFDGTTPSYDYDALNRMTQARVQPAGTSDPVVVANLEYDALSRREQLVFGDGSRQTYRYGSDDKLTSLQHGFPARPSDDVTFTYSYDPAGNQVARSISNPSYRYDGPGPVTSYGAANGLNQYTAIDGRSPEYWPDGALRTDRVNGFYFDEDRRLKVTNDWSNGARLRIDSHDGLSQRYLTHQVNPNATDYASYTVTDGIRPETAVSDWHEEPEGGPWLFFGRKHYVLGPNADERLAYVDLDGGIGFPHTDERGSTISIGYQGASISRFRYGEFGETTDGVGGQVGPYSYPFRYTGQQFDPFANTYHYKARTYSPAIGRFLQPDPSGFTDGPNLYVYVGNDPLDKIDPTGMQSVRDILDRKRVEATARDGVDSRTGLPVEGTRVTGGSASDRAQLNQASGRVFSTDRGRQFLGKIEDRGKPVDVKVNSKGIQNSIRGTTRVNIDPNNRPEVQTTQGPQTMSNEALIAHEVGHNVMGARDQGPNRMDNVRQNENPVRRALGEPERTKY